MCRLLRPKIRRHFRTLPYDIAEDLVQETLLCCIEARDRIRDTTALRAYLSTVARRKLARYLSTGSTSTVELEEHLFPGARSLGIMDPRIDVAHLLHRESSGDIRTVIEYYLGQARTPEIAERRGLPVSEVRRELRRGLAHLRRVVADGRGS